MLLTGKLVCHGSKRDTLECLIYYAKLIHSKLTVSPVLRSHTWKNKIQADERLKK